jgi:type I restriction enzyme R subunit
MMAHAYSEKALVESAALEVLSSLGWATVSADDEVLGVGGTLGRDMPSEVVLVVRLRAALVKLNPDLPSGAIDLALDDLLRDRAAMGPAAANREVHRLLTAGVKATLKDQRTGQDEERTLRVVDWDHPEENDFLAVQQLSLKGPLYTCIPDVILCVNGLPLVVIELKRPGVAVRQASTRTSQATSIRRTACRSSSPTTRC